MERGTPAWQDALAQSLSGYTAACDEAHHIVDHAEAEQWLLAVDKLAPDLAFRFLAKWKRTPHSRAPTVNDLGTWAEVEECLGVVVQVSAAARHTVTSFEADIWLEQLERYGPRPVRAFLVNWVSTMPGGKPPAVADLRKELDKSFATEETALETVRDLVTRLGGWESPPADRISPVIARTIEGLGGWVRVVETMPDPGEPKARFEWQAFVDRFGAAFRTAQSQEFQQTLVAPEKRSLPPPVRGAHEASRILTDARKRLAIERQAQALALPGEDVAANLEEAPR